METLKNSETDFYKQTKDIITNYVDSGVLNISGADKKNTSQAFSALNQNSTKNECVEIFTTLVEIVKLELSCDSFPRFIRHPMCIEFCQKNHENRKVLELNKIVQFDYSNEEFTNPIVTEKDFEFAEWIMNDTLNW